MKHKEFVAVLMKRYVRRAAKDYGLSTKQFAHAVQHVANEWVVQRNRSCFSCNALSFTMSALVNAPYGVHNTKNLLTAYYLSSMGVTPNMVQHQLSSMLMDNIHAYANIPWREGKHKGRGILLQRYAKKVWEYV